MLEVSQSILNKEKPSIQGADFLSLENCWKQGIVQQEHRTVVFPVVPRGKPNMVTFNCEESLKNSRTLSALIDLTPRMRLTAVKICRSRVNRSSDS